MSVVWRVLIEPTTPTRENVAEKCHAQSGQPRAHHAAWREQVPAEHARGQRRGQQHGRARARHSQGRDRAIAEDQQRGQRDEQQHADADRRRRHQHVAGAADDAGQRIHQPDQHVARKHDVGVLQRCRQRSRLPAHGAVELRPEQQEHGGKAQAEQQIDDQRVQRPAHRHRPACRRPARGRSPTRCRRPWRRRTASASS